MITTNTDGNPISQAFADAMEQPSAMYSMKLYRNGTDLGAIIKGAKLDLGAGQSSDDLGTFAACGVYQTQFSASLYDCPSILGEELEVHVGVLTGNAYEYVAVAYVTITEESVWKGVTDVRGVGRMGLMHAPHGLADGDYQPAAVASAIYAATGIPVSIDARLTTQSVHADAGGTCRDALESMCARLGAFACELGEGISVMPYSSTATGTIPTGHVTGKPELGALYEVDGITVESESGELVQGTGRVHIVDGTATATTAAATWGNMRGYAFTPANLAIALIDPRWTVADTLSVTLDGDAYAIPARGMSITYDGGYFGTVSAAGLTADAEDMIVEGPLTSRVESAYDLAAEAKAVAEATGQYFWHDSNGAHVSTEALNPTGPSNSLWNSLGLLIRKAANNLVSITQSAIAFYDGNGNNASNITAQFGSSGATIGKTGGNHICLDTTGIAVNEGSSNVARFKKTADGWGLMQLGGDSISISGKSERGESYDTDTFRVDVGTEGINGGEIYATAYGDDGRAAIDLSDSSGFGVSFTTPDLQTSKGIRIAMDSSGYIRASVTGSDTASELRNTFNVPTVGNQANQNVTFTAGSGTSQVQLISFNVVNSSHALSGKRLNLIIRHDGISLYNGTDSSTVWSTVVSTSSPTLANATATAFELRKTGSVVNLQINQLKVSASLADGSTVSLGSGIIPSGSRPARAIGIPLVANVAGKGAGCWLYITGAGSVTLYNRSGSALGTDTNLYGNTTWVV